MALWSSYVFLKKLKTIPQKKSTGSGNGSAHTECGRQRGIIEGSEKEYAEEKQKQTKQPCVCEGEPNLQLLKGPRIE